MLLCVRRTTVLLPDDLFRELKARAAREGTSLGSLLDRLLRQGLRERRAPRRFNPPTSHGEGLQPGVDLTDRDALYERMGGRR
jgi:plasmid stability protein